MKVDKARYGKYDISGVRDGDPEPCPRVWDENRKCWSDEWKGMLYNEELRYYQDIYDTMDYRLKDKCEDPETLLDIANAGIEWPDAATNAIAELLEQLYNTD